jgi:hypothetical protein
MLESDRLSDPMFVVTQRCLSNRKVAVSSLSLLGGGGSLSLLARMRAPDQADVLSA